MVTHVAITDQSIASGGVDERVDQIHAQTSAELTIQTTGGTLTTDGSEQTLYQDDEPLGVWCPVALIIDLDDMSAGETVEIKVYHRLSDAGGLQLFQYETWTGGDGSLPNSRKVDVLALYPNRHGWLISLELTAGANIDVPWELYFGV